MEGPPSAPEVKEKEPISDEQCREALKQGNFELVKEWYAEREVIADQDPSGNGRTDLAIKMGRLQFEAGLTDYARDTLEAAYENAYQQGDDEIANHVRSILDRMQ